MRKFTKQFLGPFVVAQGGVEGCIEDSKIMAFSSATNGSCPPTDTFEKEHAFITARIVAVLALIVAIAFRSVAQVFTPIVQSIMVFVIDCLKLRANQTMHFHPTATSAAPRVVGPRLFVPIGIPIPSRNPLKVSGIDNRILIVRQGDKAVRFVKRLDYVVSLHAAFHRCTSHALKFGLYSIIALWFLVTPAYSQVQLAPAVKLQYFSANGVPLAGGCIFTYQSGTSTPLASYTDFTGGTPNPNPIILGSDGRPTNDVWLLGQAYRIKLVAPGGVSCSTGTQIWVEDGINPSGAALLSSNNTWLGTQTFQATTNFNAQANFNVGLVSLGPNTLGGGGSITGTWSGSPTLTGIWNFQAELDAVNIVYSGQIFSSIATGTAPLVITSTTQVPNLNASLLEGCTWESPCPIGGTTPNTAHFTAIVDTGLFTLGGSNVSSIKGTDPALYTAGTIAGGAGNALCTDANGSATTSGCTTPLISRGQLGVTSCTTGNSSFDTCTSVITISPAQPDTSYVPSCTGVSPSDPRALIQTSFPTSTTTVTATVITEGSVAVSFGNIGCTATHL